MRGNTWALARGRHCLPLMVALPPPVAALPPPLRFCYLSFERKVPMLSMSDNLLCGS